MRDNKKIGLSLSGGGYRATAYHLGTLKKLDQLGILDDIDVISTNSGGSIIGAAYGLYGSNFDQFEKIILGVVKSSVLKGVIKSTRFIVSLLLVLIWLTLSIYFLFTNYEWVSLISFISFVIVILLFQFQLFPLSKLIEKVYNNYIFKKKNLSDLSSDIKIVINSTNLETGRLFTFSRNKMGDSSYDYPVNNGKPVLFDPIKFPIARAVAASTCVPFIFSPVVISPSFYRTKADLSRAKPRLIDGGIYDNQGVHKLVQDNSSYACDIIIVSDAGNIIPFKNSYRNVLALLIRTSDVFMNRIKNFQMIQLLYETNLIGKREVAYQSLGWDLTNSIPEFIRGIKKGLILKHVLLAHHIQEEDISNGNWEKIEEKLKVNIGYNEIIKDANSKNELSVARNVKTSLVALKDNEVKALIKHASSITEIQLKLYCPTLIK